MVISVRFFFGATDDATRIKSIPTPAIAAITPVATPRGAGAQAGSILPPPTSPWTAQFTSTLNPGTNIVTTSLPVLDLNFTSAPFAGLPDNAWSVDAAAGFILNPGHYTFGILHDGELHVYVDNREVASDPDPATARTVDVAFDTKGGVSVIRIVATDNGGPFQLKFLSTDPKTLT